MPADLVGTEIVATGRTAPSPRVAEPADAPTLSGEPWRTVLRPRADLRRLLAPRSAWAILALASGDARFAARVADGLDAPEASRARRRLEADGLIALLPLLAGRAGCAWCSVADQAALARLLDDPRVLSSGDADDPARHLQGYIRASDLPALVDDHGLHTAPDSPGPMLLLRPLPDPWPFPDGAVAVPRLVGALDLLELAAKGHPVDVSQVWAAWEPVTDRGLGGGWLRRDARPTQAHDQRTGGHS
jgi:hypothetical protein